MRRITLLGMIVSIGCDCPASPTLYRSPASDAARPVAPRVEVPAPPAPRDDEHAGFAGEWSQFSQSGWAMRMRIAIEKGRPRVTMWNVNYGLAHEVRSATWDGPRLVVTTRTARTGIETTVALTATDADTLEGHDSGGDEWWHRVGSEKERISMGSARASDHPERFECTGSGSSRGGFVPSEAELAAVARRVRSSCTRGEALARELLACASLTGTTLVKVSIAAPRFLACEPTVHAIEAAGRRWIKLAVFVGHAGDEKACRDGREATCGAHFDRELFAYELTPAGIVTVYEGFDDNLGKCRSGTPSDPDSTSPRLAAEWDRLPSEVHEFLCH